jgi:hypothetical protein
MENIKLENKLDNIGVGSPTIIEEFLTTQELSQKIKMAPGTINNLVWKKELIENIHYLKPTPKKRLFMWSAVAAWLYRKASYVSMEPSKKKQQDNCRIHI